MRGEAAAMAAERKWPSTWRRMTLAEAGKWLSGGTPSTSNEAFWGGDIPWISAASLKGFHLTDSDRRLTRLGAVNGSRLVPKGTTLFVVRGMSLKSEFRIGVAERELAFGQDCKAIIPGEGIDPHFLAHAIRVRTPEILRMVEETSHGTGRLDTARLQTVEIFIPPLDEQRRIVAVHAAFERRVAAMERVAGKLRVTRRSLAADLLSGPLTSLREALSEKPKNGFSPAETSEWSGLLALGLGCLTSEGFIPQQLKRIPDTLMARNYQLEDGDVLISRSNTRKLVGMAGRYRDVGHPCIYPDLMMRLIPDGDRCIPEYLELALQSASVRREIQASARGTSESMVKISSAVVESLKIPLPGIKEQRRVSNIVSSFDAQIAKREALIAKARVVLQGVMKDLLDGRV